MGGKGVLKRKGGAYTYRTQRGNLETLKKTGRGEKEKLITPVERQADGRRNVQQKG